MCSVGTYNSSSDIMFVRSVLENAGVSLPSCREYRPSTVWGLLDSTQQYNWYNGQREQWNVSLQEVATLGHGGIRLSDLLASSARDFDAEMFLRIKRDPDHHIWNAQFEHTIAQPVCNGTYKDYLRQNLSEYFMDVLFPMAHSVYEAPSQAICGRWVTEYALYALLSNVSGATDPCRGGAEAHRRAVAKEMRSAARADWHLQSAQCVSHRPVDVPVLRALSVLDSESSQL
jgi:hypothetical protein